MTFFPNSLSFSNQIVGSTSGQQISALTNTGNGTLNITNISVTGANSADFNATNNCGNSIAANGSCNIVVTFTPSATGARTAAVSITDNAPNSPQTLPLTGVSNSTPSFNLGASPSSTTLNPGSSAAYTISVIPMNGFSGAVNLSCGVAGSGIQPPTCALNPASISAGGTLSTLTLTTTAASGPNAGTTAGNYTITVTGTSGNNLLSSVAVNLAVSIGAPPTFTISASPTNVAVMPGSSAAYTVSLTPQNGFNQSASLACSTPANDKLACSFNLASVSPGTSSTLTVTTTAPTTARLQNGKSLPLYGMWLLPVAIMFSNLGPLPRKKLVFFLLGLVFVVTLLLVGCGGGASSSSNNTATTVPGTPAGNYTVTVTATSGSLTQTTNVTLIVQ